MRRGKKASAKIGMKNRVKKYGIFISVKSEKAALYAIV
jgi:hypothetical protein